MELRYMLLAVGVSIISIFALWSIFEPNLSYVSIVVLGLVIGWPLTLTNQAILHSHLQVPFARTINIINKVFGTRFKTPNIEEIRAGIPYTDYGYKEGIYIGRRISPLKVADALIHYLDKGRVKDARRAANWLLDNYTIRRGFVIWPIQYPRPFYRLNPGWVSGFYQARILRALYKLYARSGDKRYYDLVLKGLRAFMIDLDKGGLRIKGKKGFWYPEYGQARKSPPFVLNGFIYCLLDLYYIYQKTKNKKAKYLFDKGLQELKVQINIYDSGDWTYYDRLKNPARYDYHVIHVLQLNDLYKITKEERFLKLKQKWEKYKRADGRFYLINVILFNILVISISFLTKLIR